MSGIWLVIVVAYVALVYFGRAQQEAKRKAQGGQGGGSAPDAAARAARREALRQEMEAQRESTTRYNVVLEPQPTGSRSRYAPRVVAEEEVPEEVPVDYDAEAVQTAEARRRAAESPAFLPARAAGSGMQPAQAAPPASAITSRIESRIVDRIGAPQSAAPAPAAAARVTAAQRLGRFATGGLRGAFVLSEIFGPPRGDS